MAEKLLMGIGKGLCENIDSYDIYKKKPHKVKTMIIRIG